MFPKNRVLFSLLAVFLCLFFVQGAPAKAKTAPAPAVWPHENSDIPPDPALTFGRLNNGFRYVFMQNNEPKDRVAVFLDVQAGSLMEEDNQRGLAHYLEHMLFDGTTHFPPGELIKYFQNIGMRYGPEVNAHTGFDETVYHVLLPKGGEKNMDEAFLVMADYAAGALLLPEEVEKEKGVILAEKRQRDSVSYRTFVAGLEFLLPGTRVIHRMPIGEAEVIEAADKALLEGYYNDWYRPERLVLVVVGDFDQKTAQKLMEKHFGGLKARGQTPAPPSPGTFSHQGEKFFYHYEKEAGNTDVSIETAWNMTPRQDSLEWQKELIYLNMANAVLKFRLNKIKESPDCPFTSAGANAGTFLKEIAFSSINAASSPDKWEPSLALIENEIRRALTYGFTKAEVQRVQKTMRAMLETARSRASTRDSSSLARNIIASINDDQVFTSPDQDVELYLPVMEAATPADLLKVFKKYWPDTHRLVQVTGNAQLGDKPLEKIEKVYRAALAAKVAPPEKQRQVSFPFFKLPAKKAAVKWEKQYPEIGVTRFELENGVTVGFKKTDFKADQILFSLLFGQGQSQEPENKPGLASLAPSVLNDSGVGPLTRDELVRALAGTTTSLAFSVGQDRFTFSGQTTRKELELAFQLVYAHLSEPAFRPDAYDRAMERYSQMYEALGHKIEGALTLEGYRFFADGDSRFGLPGKEQFMALTLEDARSWVLDSMKNSPLEFSVVGDFEPEEVKRLARLYLGALPRAEDQKTALRSDVVGFPAGKEKTVRVPTVLEKGLVMVAWKSDSVWDIHQTRRSAILGDVFTDRLRETIREKMGASYSPQAWNEPSRAYKDYGVIKAYVAAKPEQTGELAREIKNIAAGIVKEGVTEDELKRSIEPSVTSIKDLLRKNPYWLNTVLSGASRHPLQLEWCKTILDDYKSITSQEVWDLAKKYLQPQKAARFTVLPEPASKEAAPGGEGS